MTAISGGVEEAAGFWSVLSVVVSAAAMASPSFVGADGTIVLAGVEMFFSVGAFDSFLASAAGVIAGGEEFETATDRF